MRLGGVTALTLIIASLAPQSVLAGGQGPTNDPIFASGVRTVDIRTTTGSLSRYTTIPWASQFASHGGRTTQCSFTADADGVTHDGQHYVAGQTIYSDRWIFTESTLVTGGEMGDSLDLTLDRGPMTGAFRQFKVSCDAEPNMVGFILVPITDPMIDPHTRLDRLYNQLQLEPPTVWPNPVVAKWGGLVTRFPAWLAIGSTAWRTQRSNTEDWRGWLMYLRTVPKDLAFWVEFTPDPSRPSTPFVGLVPCVAASGEIANTDVMYPPMPTLLDQSTPGMNWPCVWTPPGPGQVTVTAIINYGVSFWVSGYTEALPDYLWLSEPVTFRTGDLPAVNVNA